MLGALQVVPKLLRFIDSLTNIYVRFNRKRLKGRTGELDCGVALSTLFHVSLSAGRPVQLLCCLPATWGLSSGFASA